MKDFQGNDVVAGDTVHVKLGAEWVVATVVKTQEGGLSLPNAQNGQPGVTPDVLVLQVVAFFTAQTGANHGDLMKLQGAPKPALVC